MGRVKDNKIVSLGPDHKILIDGPEILDNVEYGWKDMTSSLAAGKAVGANAPTWGTFRDGLSAYAFSDTTMNEMWIIFHPNHDIIEGEDFFMHIHWAPNTTDTGVVRWGFEYTIAKGYGQEAFPASTTVYVEETISADSQYKHIITEQADGDGIPMPEVDSLIQVRVFRDGAHANDTFGADVFGLTADLHYRSGKFATVGKRPDFNLPD